MRAVTPRSFRPAIYHNLNPTVVCPVNIERPPWQAARLRARLGGQTPMEPRHRMSIWRRKADPAEMEARFQDSLPGLFGIRIIEVGPDFIRAEMPVDQRHAQPFGILHGGASVVLAETLGSIASSLTLPEDRRAVGLEVNANHVTGVPVGQVVSAICRPLHLGRTTQVWQTEIHRADGRLACVSRLTTAVIERRE